MAWVETYHCDVCGKAKTEEATDWWLTWYETTCPAETEKCQPVFKISAWSVLLSHTKEVKHLCGGRCAQTLMDRWMHS